MKIANFEKVSFFNGLEGKEKKEREGEKKKEKKGRGKKKEGRDLI